MKTKLSYYIFILFLSLGFSESVCQTIIGNVYDLTNKQPIPDVIILLKPSQDKISAIQTSDPDGNFLFTNVRLDEFIIQTQHLSYEDKVIKKN